MEIKRIEAFVLPDGSTHSSVDSAIWHLATDLVGKALQGAGLNQEEAQVIVQTARNAPEADRKRFRTVMSEVFASFPAEQAKAAEAAPPLAGGAIGGLPPKRGRRRKKAPDPAQGAQPEVPAPQPEIPAPQPAVPAPQQMPPVPLPQFSTGATPPPPLAQPMVPGQGFGSHVPL